ncbi:Fc.00g021390.m01.CDS01 [Cosmosporella sp. VM-42]
MSSTVFYPPSPKDALRALYLGKSIREVPTPAAIINVAAVRRNCERMLSACESLGLEWRAHVKTHKTEELTRLQVGDDLKGPVKLIVSTLAEAEFLLPLLSEYKAQGRLVNVMYGIPLNPGAVPRLAAIARDLGQCSISVLLDDPAQVAPAKQIHHLSGTAIEVYIKIEMGAKRAGVRENSDRFVKIVDAILEAQSAKSIVLGGLYSHAGHSYAGDSRAAAIKMLDEEYTAMLLGADTVRARAGLKGILDVGSLVLSAGASPTALSIQNLLSSPGDDSLQEFPDLKRNSEALSKLFDSMKDQGYRIEIHAGVYPTLDLQQISIHSLSFSTQSWTDIALTLIAEVHGIYPGRGTNGTDEALIGAGVFALGREPFKAYEGMAMLTPWGRPGVEMPTCSVEEHQGWVVGRFSQEHGIVTWASGKSTQGEGSKPDVLEAGQKIRLWPNHACITSGHFGWYFVVDESREGKEDEIVDIWVRAWGW